MLISVLSDAEDMILTTVSEENRFYLLTMQYGTDLMFGDGKSVCDEFSHVDGTAATGVFGSCVVWSIGERLVWAVERAERAAGAEPHLLRSFAKHNRSQVVQLLLIASGFVQQNVDARLVWKFVKLWLSRQYL